MRVQRIRVTFSRGEQLKFISHLDLMRLWERAFRRAGVEVAYSEGFTPHARISLAAPLAVGVTSGGELLDVTLSKRMPVRGFAVAVSRQLPEGVALESAIEVGLNLPAVQSAVRAAEYEVEVETERSDDDVRGAVAGFLAAESVPWEHARDKETRRYDIRALVQDVRFAGRDESGLVRLMMRLRTDNSASGRPEQVAAALGLPETWRIHRARLLLEEVSPAREAWRRRGRFE